MYCFSKSDILIALKFLVGTLNQSTPKDYDMAKNKLQSVS